MGFGDADIRGSHTIRIFGTNAAGELLPDVWLDIERVDVFRITTQVGGHFQGLYRRLYWMDDPLADDYSETGNPARTEGTKKICAPDEEDQEHPAEWVPVRTIIEMSFNESSDHDRLRGRRGNRTSADNLVRTVAARRAFHRDTLIDDAAGAAADEGRPAYVVASDQYDFVEGSKDEDDFIEVQYVSHTMEMSSAREDQGKSQGVVVTWKNIHYLNFTEEAQGPVNPVHGFDPPWSLDPFQAIVNVQFSPPVIVVFHNVGGSFVVGAAVEQRVKDLGAFSITPGSGFDELHAFKVNPKLKDTFVSSISQNFALPSVTAFVCPMTGDDEASLQDALAAVRAYFPGTTPRTIPPGIAWVAVLGGHPPAAAIPWKITRVKHRAPGDSTLPDMMTQVYPRGVTPSSTVVGLNTISYFGFNVIGYRLDKPAEGQVYDGGGHLGSVSVHGTPPLAWTSDVILTTSASGAANYGVKFQADLPLISDDTAA